MTSVIVTGSQGKLGRVVVDELTAAGYDVHGLDSQLAPASHDYTRIDLTDYGQTVSNLCLDGLGVGRTRLEGLDEPSWTVDDTIRLAKMLPDLGVDLLDVSSGGNSPDVADSVHGRGESSSCPMCHLPTKAVSIPAAWRCWGKKTVPSGTARWLSTTR